MKYCVLFTAHQFPWGSGNVLFFCSSNPQASQAYCDTFLSCFCSFSIILFASVFFSCFFSGEIYLCVCFLSLFFGTVLWGQKVKKLACVKVIRSVALLNPRLTETFFVLWGLQNFFFSTPVPVWIFLGQSINFKFASIPVGSTKNDILQLARVKFLFFHFPLIFEMIIFSIIDPLKFGFKKNGKW